MVGFQAMTERLYYRDSYLRAFRARVASRQGDVVYLDRSAFYPRLGRATVRYRLHRRCGGAGRDR